MHRRQPESVRISHRLPLCWPTIGQTQPADVLALSCRLPPPATTLQPFASARGGIAPPFFPRLAPSTLLAGPSRLASDLQLCRRPPSLLLCHSFSGCCSPPAASLLPRHPRFRHSRKPLLSPAGACADTRRASTLSPNAHHQRSIASVLNMGAGPVESSFSPGIQAEDTPMRTHSINVNESHTLRGLLAAKKVLAATSLSASGTRQGMRCGSVAVSCSWLDS